MKRNRSVERALKMHLWDSPYFVPPHVMPPLTLVKLVSSSVASLLGIPLDTEFRVGFYSKQDGPNVVWLVDKNGIYGQTIDQQILNDGFAVVQRSHELDTYGVNSRQMGAL